jgi:hypothetical protein
MGDSAAGDAEARAKFVPAVQKITWHGIFERARIKEIEPRLQHLENQYPSQFS